MTRTQRRRTQGWAGFLAGLLAIGLFGASPAAAVCSQDPCAGGGDPNRDCVVNVSDAACTLEWLFAGADVPGCVAALNTNGDGEVNIADPVAVLNFLFGRGLAPVAPFPDCGPGTLPADTELGCTNAPDCQ